MGYELINICKCTYRINETGANYKLLHPSTSPWFHGKVGIFYQTGIDNPKLYKIVTTCLQQLLYKEDILTIRTEDAIVCNYAEYLESSNSF